MIPYQKQRDLSLKRQLKFSNFEAWRDIVVGLVFSVGGSIDVPNKPDYVWVHEWGSDYSQAQALRSGITVEDGMPVMMARDPKNPFHWKILGLYTGGLDPGVTNQIIKYELGLHGQNHQWPAEDNKGLDAVPIFQPAISPFKTEGNGSDLIITLWGGTFWYGATPYTFSGAQLDISSSVPTAGNTRYVLVGVDKTTNTIDTVDGSTVAVPATPSVPTVPDDFLPSALVQLTGGQTDVTTVDDVTDTREMFSGDIGGGAGGVTGPVSSTDNAAARWNGAGGDTLQDSELIIADDGLVTVQRDDAATNTVTPAGRFRHNSSGTTAAGFGTSVEFYAESVLDGDNTEMGEIGFRWEVNTGSFHRSAFVITPESNGSLFETAVFVGTNNSIAGNIRGEGSFDLQSSRSAATQVASGTYCGIFAGLDNTNDSHASAILGGYANSTGSSSWYSGIVAGSSNLLSSSDYAGILAGYNNDVSSSDYGAVVGGDNNSVNSAIGSVVVGGSGLTVSGARSVMLGGFDSTSGSPAEVSAGAPVTGTLGKVIDTISARQHLLQASHTDTTWYSLSPNFVWSTNFHIVGEIFVVGVTSDVSPRQTWAYRIEFACDYQSTIHTQTLTTIYEYDSAYEADISIPSNNNLVVRVRRNGGTDRNIRWAATIRAIRAAA